MVCAAGSLASAARAAESNRNSTGTIATMAGRVGGAVGARNISLEFVAPRTGSQTVANLQSTLEPRLNGDAAIPAPGISAVGSTATRPAVSLEAAVNTRRVTIADQQKFRSLVRGAQLAPSPQMTLGWNDALTRSNVAIDSPLTKASYSPHEAIVPTTGEISLPPRESVFSATAVVESVGQPASAFANSRLDFASEPANSSFQPLASPQQIAPAMMHRTR